nr:ribosomal protein S18-alanine N-acetyltransferase [Janibacter alkaliphilus]
MGWPDLEQVAALEQELFPQDAWDLASWWHELAGRPRRDYLVLTDPDGVLGYAGLDHGGEVSDVMTIAVHPRGRGHGLGQRLLDELVARARQAGAQRIMLEVRADNAAARGLYERSGFATVATRRGYYQSVDALVLAHELTRPSADQTAADQPAGGPA